MWYGRILGLRVSGRVQGIGFWAQGVHGLGWERRMDGWLDGWMHVCID